jgi:uncharacterized protein YjcR
MVNRFRELLPYDEVPIRLVFRGRVRGEHEEELTSNETERPVKRVQTQATRAKPKPKTKHVKRPPEKKPHLKKAHRGAQRGTRPK